jgi:hypothetical protein
MRRPLRSPKPLLYTELLPLQLFRMLSCGQTHIILEQALSIRPNVTRLLLCSNGGKDGSQMAV